MPTLSDVDEARTFRAKMSIVDLAKCQSKPRTSGRPSALLDAPMGDVEMLMVRSPFVRDTTLSRHGKGVRGLNYYSF